VDRRRLLSLGLAAGFTGAVRPALAGLRGTGDLAVIVARASGRIAIAETTGPSLVATVEGLGDLSHASVVFSRDQRFAFVFGRDGGLSKVDLLEARIVGRVVQAGNSIGGAISEDGALVAVANYEPGGVRVFDSATLDPLADIPATLDGAPSKALGLVDAPGRVFVYALYEAGAIAVADLSDPARPAVRLFENVGRLPYDGMITADGRFYVAGLYGEDGLALLDLWNPEAGVRRILDGYGRGEEPLPVYKMPHLEGWAATGEVLFLPAVGRHELLAVDRRTWTEAGRVALAGQPVFAVASPDGRRVWVNFAHPDNDRAQVIDVPSFEIVATPAPGRAILHMEFTPRGEEIWISARDDDRVVVLDADSFATVAALQVEKPSGIFMTARAHRIGQ
jgi:protein NirF